VATAGVIEAVNVMLSPALAGFAELVRVVLVEP